VMALAAGCSSLRFGYQQGPDLAYWWLDRYVDFDDTQEPRAREAIAAWFRWHRSSQLPDYAALLARAQAEIAEPMSAARMCRWIDEVNARLDAAFETFRSPSAPYAAYQQRLKQYNCAFAAQVHQLATPEQRSHAVKRLKGWEDDARALAAQTPG